MRSCIAKFQFFKILDEKIKKYDIQEVQRQIALLNVYSKKKRKKENQLTKDKNVRFFVKDYLLMALSSVKKLNVDYQNGSAISGFYPDPGFFGQGNYSDFGIYSGRGPSWGFLFGNQSGIRQKAIEHR